MYYSKMPQPPLIISIEGNIGSGKSTFLEQLRLKYSADPTICFLMEPVDIWSTITDTSGATILEKYYADQHKYAFTFQMMAYISRLSLIRSALKKNYRIIIVERSIYTDSVVFAKMLFDDKKIEEIEYKIYLKWFDEFIDDFPPTRFVYMRAEPTVSYQRVLLRARSGEIIPLDYLQNCHAYHENWLMNLPDTEQLLILNANSELSDSLEHWLNAVEQFMTST